MHTHTHTDIYAYTCLHRHTHTNTRTRLLTHMRILHITHAYKNFIPLPHDCTRHARVCSGRDACIVTEYCAKDSLSSRIRGDACSHACARVYEYVKKNYLCKHIHTQTYTYTHTYKYNSFTQTCTYNGMDSSLYNTPISPRPHPHLPPPLPPSPQPPPFSP
jgi:hypothetical protein